MHTVHLPFDAYVLFHKKIIKKLYDDDSGNGHYHIITIYNEYLSSYYHINKKS